MDEFVANIKKGPVVNYFIVYIASLLFFGVGAITTLGLDWYDALTLPSWIPPTQLVAVIWGVLFVLTAISSGIVWNKGEHDKAFRTTIYIYMGNALLILLWNYLFFGMHQLFMASVAAIAVGISVLILMIRTWKISHNASLMLLPYFVWIIVALYLNYLIWTLNS